MTDTTIKAIETRYNGYRFRSRLEARWAVFFDTLGVKYEYEPEGYELSEVGRYLPDFYIPHLDWFAEIKPGHSLGKPLSDKERMDMFKAACLSFHTKHEVAVIQGDPSEHKIVNYVMPTLIQHNRQLMYCRSCYTLLLGYCIQPEMADYGWSYDYHDACWGWCERCDRDSTWCWNATVEPMQLQYAQEGRHKIEAIDHGAQKWDDHHVARWLEAIEAARSARFEYGENGRMH